MCEKKPNIVFILSDDQGAWALGCAGNPEIKTPNLDRLASDGIRFENFFCVSPVCSPARASIVTGKIPSGHGVHDWIRGGNIDIERFPELKDKPVFASESKPIRYLDGHTTYTDVLAQNGYVCALSGKWHLGDSIEPQHGFTKWFTIARGGCNYYNADVVRNGKIEFENRYITDVITENALNNLEELGNGNQPFYLSVHYTSPHSPWDENNHPREYLDMYKDCECNSCPELPIHPNQVNSAPYGVGEARKKNIKGYYAAITAMDNGIGRILDKIEALGIADNTIIVFTSDNGMNLGHHGVWGKGNGTFPQNMYDTSVKVPFIISHPNSISRGMVEESLFSHYDFMHTLLDYIGIKHDFEEELPGKSFAPILRGSNIEGENEIVVFDEYGPVRMIRTKEWKYVHRYPYGPNELYNLKEDPSEDNNLIDSECGDKIRKELKHHLEQWFNKYANKKLDGTKEAVFGSGQLNRPGEFSLGEKSFSDDIGFYHK